MSEVFMRLLLRALVVCATGLCAFTSDAQFFSRRTKHLDLLYYSESHEPLTHHLTRAFENSLGFHRRLLNYTPTEPIFILMEDFGDFGHGGATTVPRNDLQIGISPFDYVYDTVPTNERMNWLMNHELAHIAITDKGADRDLMFRRLFRGKVAPSKEAPISMFYSYLTAPRWYSPRWYLEGSAVFLETWMAGGIGRSLGGYDEMVFRTMVLENSDFYDVVGLESEGTSADFQVGATSYLYGTRFMSYLAQLHGPEKVIAWFDRPPGSRAYFASQFAKVFGTELATEWRRWIEFEKQWQKGELATIREYPLTDVTPIVKESIGSVARSFFEPERRLLITAVNRVGREPQVVTINIDTGEMKEHGEVFGAALYYVAALAWEPRERKVFFTTKNPHGRRDLVELDLDTNRQQVLIREARIGDLVINPADQSLWGVRHDGGYSSLVRLEKPYREWETVMRLDYGRDLFDLDISPDGTKLTGSAIEISGRQQLVAWDIAALRAGDSRFEPVHEFPDNSPSNFVFSPDGRYLFGTTYLTGVSNIFRYDFETKKMDALTNVETGLFRPLPIDGTTMLAYRFTAKGFVPVTIRVAPIADVNAIRYLGQQVVEKFPVVKEWNAGSPARVDLDEVTTYKGPYLAREFMRFGPIYPVVEGYKSKTVGGAKFTYADPFAVHYVDVTLGLSRSEGLQSSERFHARATYAYYPWELKLAYNPSNFYDLFGPTKVSRKGWSAALSRVGVIRSDRPKVLSYRVNAATYGGLDTVPDYQNVRTAFDKYSTLAGQLIFTDVRRTLGAIENNRGTKWSLATSANLVNSGTFPRIRGSFSRGVLLPLEHSALWVHAAAGKSWGDRSNPFANFYFGGFGNNYVDNQEVRRYTEHESLPGREINELGGNSFGKATIDLQLPPVKFARAGIPGLYARWARLNLFASSLATNVTNDTLRENVTSIGAQLDFNVVMFSWLDSTLSVGYATARGSGKTSDEVMISLKLLR